MSGRAKLICWQAASVAGKSQIDSTANRTANSGREHLRFKLSLVKFKFQTKCDDRQRYMSLRNGATIPGLGGGV